DYYCQSADSSSKHWVF
nr:immunoglobulin light chain junction region [Macaca mulatta]MOW28197.1 immunoglobulin light chain junction region [Macaca mulatta]MOW28658.1 immunoglobulin light chain junction region [Macaca mulatta]MOW29237.1 immunoglobulin light chain junction region [Macaca mulatta]MOW29522.1 immunoglobulin light chain junction region [Macaca mulatta]